eukprot:IDg10343t1
MKRLKFHQLVDVSRAGPGTLSCPKLSIASGDCSDEVQGLNMWAVEKHSAAF